MMMTGGARRKQIFEDQRTVNEERVFEVEEGFFWFVDRII